MSLSMSTCHFSLFTEKKNNHNEYLRKKYDQNDSSLSSINGFNRIYKHSVTSMIRTELDLSILFNFQYEENVSDVIRNRDIGLNLLNYSFSNSNILKDL